MTTGGSKTAGLGPLGTLTGLLPGRSDTELRDLGRKPGSLALFFFRELKIGDKFLSLEMPPTEEKRLTFIIKTRSLGQRRGRAVCGRGAQSTQE